MPDARRSWTSDRVALLARAPPLPHVGRVTDQGTPISTSTSMIRHRVLPVFGAVALLLAACDTGTDDELQPPPVEDPATDPEPDDLAPDADPDEGDPADDDTATDTGVDPEDDDQADGAAPLDGDPATDLHEREGESGTLAVTDVRIATHDGFDRIVFETDGDGVPGWFVEYAEATAQGSGEQVEVDGDVTLRVAVRMVTLPPDLPEGLEVWDGDRLDGPPGGIVLELVEDTIFEGHHTFFVGLDDERPFVVDLLDDPHRVVIDVHHDG
jgi:hypothetical protein